MNNYQVEIIMINSANIYFVYFTIFFKVYYMFGLLLFLHVTQMQKNHPIITYRSTGQYERDIFKIPVIRYVEVVSIFTGTMLAAFNVNFIVMLIVIMISNLYIYVHMIEHEFIIATFIFSKN